jgi:hypothetical protein
MGAIERETVVFAHIDAVLVEAILPSPQIRDST